MAESGAGDSTVNSVSATEPDPPTTTDSTAPPPADAPAAPSPRSIIPGHALEPGVHRQVLIGFDDDEEDEPPSESDHHPNSQPAIQAFAYEDHNYGGGAKARPDTEEFPRIAPLADLGYVDDEEQHPAAYSSMLGSRGGASLQQLPVPQIHNDSPNVIYRRADPSGQSTTFGPVQSTPGHLVITKPNINRSMNVPTGFRPVRQDFTTSSFTNRPRLPVVNTAAGQQSGAHFQGVPGSQPVVKKVTTAPRPTTAPRGRSESGLPITPRTIVAAPPGARLQLSDPTRAATEQSPAPLLVPARTGRPPTRGRVGTIARGRPTIVGGDRLDHVGTLPSSGVILDTTTPSASSSTSAAPTLQPQVLTSPIRQLQGSPRKGVLLQPPRPQLVTQTGQALTNGARRNTDWGQQMDDEAALVVNRRPLPAQFIGQDKRPILQPGQPTPIVPSMMPRTRGRPRGSTLQSRGAQRPPYVPARPPGSSPEQQIFNTLSPQRRIVAAGSLLSRKDLDGVGGAEFSSASATAVQFNNPPRPVYPIPVTSPPRPIPSQVVAGSPGRGRRRKSSPRTSQGDFDNQERAPSFSSEAFSNADSETSGLGASPGGKRRGLASASSEDSDEEQWPDAVTRCLCRMTHDDGLMIQCEKCDVWQHMACFGLSKNEEPEHYFCELCQPRPLKLSVDEAIAIQKKFVEKRAVLGARKKKGGRPPKKARSISTSEKSPVRARPPVKNPKAPFRTLEANSFSDRAAGLLRVVQSTPNAEEMIESLDRLSAKEKPEDPPLVRKCYVTADAEGLMLCKDAKRGDPVAELLSYVYVRTEVPDRAENGSLQPYCFVVKIANETGEELVLDARNWGNEARFVRNSCRPNAQLRAVLTKKKELRVLFIATEDIDAHDEITIPFDADFLDCPYALECTCRGPTALASCAIEVHNKDLNSKPVSQRRTSAHERMANGAGRKTPWKKEKAKGMQRTESGKGGPKSVGVNLKGKSLPPASTGLLATPAYVVKKTSTSAKKLPVSKRAPIKLVRKSVEDRRSPTPEEVREAELVAKEEEEEQKREKSPATKEDKSVVVEEIAEGDDTTTPRRGRSARALPPSPIKAPVLEKEVKKERESSVGIQVSPRRSVRKKEEATMETKKVEKKPKKEASPRDKTPGVMNYELPSERNKVDRELKRYLDQIAAMEKLEKKKQEGGPASTSKRLISSPPSFPVKKAKETPTKGKGNVGREKVPKSETQSPEPVVSSSRKRTSTRSSQGGQSPPRKRNSTATESPRDSPKPETGQTKTEEKKAEVTPRRGTRRSHNETQLRAAASVERSLSRMSQDEEAAMSALAELASVATTDKKPKGETISLSALPEGKAEMVLETGARLREYVKDRTTDFVLPVFNPDGTLSAASTPAPKGPRTPSKAPPKPLSVDTSDAPTSSTRPLRRTAAALVAPPPPPELKPAPPPPPPEPKKITLEDYKKKKKVAEGKKSAQVSPSTSAAVEATTASDMPTTSKIVDSVPPTAVTTASLVPPDPATARPTTSFIPSFDHIDEERAREASEALAAPLPNLVLPTPPPPPSTKLDITDLRKKIYGNLEQSSSQTSMSANTMTSQTNQVPPPPPPRPHPPPQASSEDQSPPRMSLDDRLRAMGLLGQTNSQQSAQTSSPQPPYCPSSYQVHHPQPHYPYSSTNYQQNAYYQQQPMSAVNNPYATVPRPGSQTQTVPPPPPRPAQTTAQQYPPPPPPPMQRY